MRRTIPLLSGLAILGVVFNHANWHALRDFLPGDLGGYPFIVTDQVGKYAIVAFMFIAGYFIAYATNGGKNDLKWEIVRARLLGLLWPWLLWAAFMTLAQSFQGRSLSLSEFVRNLFAQYYFVPLLMVYYLLAPWIARLARTNLKTMLIGAALIQIVGMLLFYARVYLPGFPAALVPWVDIGPLQYLRFALAFPLGLAVGTYPQQIKEPLSKIKSLWPWLMVGFFILSAIETSLVYASRRTEIWPVGGDQTKLTSVLFSWSLIICFVVFEKINLPLSKLITQVGTRSYGMYLSHYVILGLLGRLVRIILPDGPLQTWLLLPLLFVLTTAISMLLMEVTMRLPTKRFYRFIFG